MQSVSLFSGTSIFLFDETWLARLGLYPWSLSLFLSFFVSLFFLHMHVSHSGTIRGEVGEVDPDLWNKSRDLGMLTKHSMSQIAETLKHPNPLTPGLA